MNVRNYNPETDYPAIESLLRDTKTYGGDFDEARDTKERIDALEVNKPGSVLVSEIDNEIVGTVTLFEDGRSAWLYRFAVKKEHEEHATKILWEKAQETMRLRGHTQVLVYAPVKNSDLENRYNKLGFNDFTAYWQDIE
jgi:hypothetical protein